MVKIYWYWEGVVVQKELNTEYSILLTKLKQPLEIKNGLPGKALTSMLHKWS